MKISVKAARVNAGKTVKEAAARINVSVTTYSRKENGHKRFYAVELAELSRFFEVPYEVFSEIFFDNRCLERDTMSDGEVTK